MKQPEPFGKYLLLGVVAIGGMAEIYRARFADPNADQRDLAVKRILPSFTEDEGFVTMFKDEGNIARRLEHPNIVRVFDVGMHNTDWYIAMEFIHGTDLRILSDACEEHGKRFTPCQVARIMCETAKALDYAHKCTDDRGTPLNIVHRDATPHNIMIAYDGSVKLMDFGIAKAASRATKTRVGTVKGKSSYMSPEQARGKALDGRSDMFTLGAVTWELLTGNRLFKAASDFEILSKVLKATIIHPSDVDPNIPRELGDIVMKTLNRVVDERYATCGMLAETLENYLKWHGDGSDQQLGMYVAALTGQQGRSPSDIPDYQPAQGLYRMNEAGNFEPVHNVSPYGAPMAENPGYPPVANAPFPSISAPVAPVSQFAPPPVDAYSQGQVKARTPWGFLVTSGILFLLSLIFIMISIFGGSSAEDEAMEFVAPAASITIKSIPSGASVKVNGEMLDTKTPIPQQQAKLGDNVTIEFELDGHEPLKIERTLLSLSTDVIAELSSTASVDRKKAEQSKVQINTKPEQITVFVNGEDKGKSPVVLENMPLNQIISIELVDESRNTKELRFHTPTKAGSEEVLLSLSKTPEPVRVAPPPRAPAQPRPQAQRPRATGTKTTAAPAGKSTISVKATPWATVSIDGKRVGNTPIVNHEVSSGSHTVELTFLPKQKRVSKKVKVKSGSGVTVNYNFTTDAWQ
ncbi:MAG: serine/threonine-protein kinase [Bradymonadales bacterium]|jgi:serine/threonine protein kinase